MRCLLGGRCNRSHDLVQFFRIIFTKAQLRLRAQCGKWRAQLMGSIRCKALHGCQTVSKALKKMINRADEVPHFIGNIMLNRPQIGWRSTVKCLFKACERFEPLPDTKPDNNSCNHNQCNLTRSRTGKDIFAQTCSGTHGFSNKYLKTCCLSNAGDIARQRANANIFAVIHRIIKHRIFAQWQ